MNRLRSASRSPKILLCVGILIFQIFAFHWIVQQHDFVATTTENINIRSSKHVYARKHPSGPDATYTDTSPPTVNPCFFNHSGTTSSSHIFETRLKIALVLYADNGVYLTRYSAAIADQQCYAVRNGYHYIIDTVTSSGEVMFRKLRAIRKYMEHFDVIVGVDADVVIGNYAARIEGFVDKIHDVYLMSRFHNAEVVAGIYILKVSPRVIEWVDEWLDFEQTFHANGDNGALNMLVARTVYKELRYDYASELENLMPIENLILECEQKWTSAAGGLDLYFDFVLCLRKFLDAASQISQPLFCSSRSKQASSYLGQLQFKGNSSIKPVRIKMFAPSHGFARIFEESPSDQSGECHPGGPFWCHMLSGQDIFIHTKHPENYLRHTGESTYCSSSTLVSSGISLLPGGIEEHKRAIRRAGSHEYVFNHAQSYATHIADCYPDCPPVWHSKCTKSY